MPLRRAQYVESFRGAKGGYRLAKPPEEITVGEIVALLEQGGSVIECAENPEVCQRSETCLTRELWKKTSEAIYEKLNAFTLSDLLIDGLR
jgi:Rrf2 family protein